MGAQFTRNPLALASALQKIESADAPTTHIKQGAAHLCIADPLGRRLTSHEGFLADLLATHPPMAKRITILRGMGYAALKKEGRSEEHTSEFQSRLHLVCRLLLEKKKKPRT